MNKYFSPSTKKVKINQFYLFFRFPFRTFLHYLTGFLSSFVAVKIVKKVSSIVKEGNASFVNKDPFLNVIRLIIFGLIVFAHIALEIYLVEIYSSHLRQKLVKSYLNSRFAQSQKAKFVLSNYDNDAIEVGTKTAQIFNRCFYSLVLVLLLFFEIFKQKSTRKLIPWLTLTLSLLSMVGIRLYYLSYYHRSRRMRIIQKENKHFAELENNLEYVKTVGSEKEEIHKHRKLLKGNLKNAISLAASKSLYATLPNYVLLSYLPVLFLFFVKDAALWVSLHMCLEKLFGSWKKFFEELWAKGGYDTYSASLRNLNRTFAILENDDFSFLPSVNQLDEEKLDITFQGVDFIYPNSSLKILDNFSFVFQGGKKYLLTGTNGIGKSTLFKLIVGLYQPQEGTIKLNENETEKITSSILQRKIIFLPNNPYFFHARLGDNIVYPYKYQESLHKENLENIARKLGIMEFIDKLPRRWETVIAEKGQNLSAGQKQLVSLMRLFISDYQIYLLDEFLSNVNNDLKKKVLKVVFTELRDKTVLVISHDKEIQKYAKEIYQFTPQKLVA